MIMNGNLDQSLHVSERNLIFKTFWEEGRSNLSAFDNQLISAWNAANENGYFRYKLNVRESLKIPGKWGFLAELNLERGEIRRKPQEINSINQPFNPSAFNFTQISDEEIIFRFKLDSLESKNNDLLAINVSPISHGHSLLIPEVSACQPQVLTEHSIKLGLTILLLSGTPALRLVFNGICAYASVNHLHLHCLYINEKMLLESIELKPLQGPCWQLINYPAKGFVFEKTLQSKSDISELARNVLKLTNFLQENNEAHNLCMTRSKSKLDDVTYSSVRVYVWARKSSKGAKEISAFNPAACELFGHFSYKSEKMYSEKDENCIATVLEDITSEPFTRLCPLVKNLYLEN